MGKLAIILLCISLYQGSMAESVPYDNTASVECMDNPIASLYNGGVIQNSEFNNGLTGWSVPWGVDAAVSTSRSGNKFAASRSNGAQPSRGVFQKIQMQANTHYALSAWFQVSNGTAVVRATVKAPDGAFIAAGAVVVKSGCWTMLKGGMTAHSSGPAELFFQVRGHNVFWDDDKSQMDWVTPMSPDRLTAALQRRIKSVVKRYAGKVIAWDVVNENLHYTFFESKLGPDASPRIFQKVSKLDGTAMLFMNEFNTLEEPVDTNALPTKYTAKMEQIRCYAGNGGLKLAVGLEGHFSTPNIPYMRATLDTLGQLGVPIWLTEVDVARGPRQASYLEEVLREGYGHPNVQGIVMWAA